MARSNFSDRRPAARDGSPERLAFAFQSTVPARRAAAPEPTFATVPVSEAREWGYTGLFIFTAVLLIRPQEQFRPLGAIPIAEICAIVGLAPMLLHRFSSRLPVFRVTNESLALVFLAAVTLATMPFSIWPGGVLNVLTDTFFKVLLVFVLMMNTITSPKRLEHLTWLIVLSCGYIALRGVIDYARGVNLVEGGRLAGAVGGIFGNPNDLALNMVCFLPAAALYALSKRYTRGWRLLAAGAAMCMMATIIFTKSRGGAVGLVVVLVTLVLLSRALRPIILGGILAGGLLVGPFMPDSFWARMTTIFDEEADAREFSGSREARIDVMTDGWNTFLDHPLTGVGAGQFVNYNPPGRLEPWRETHNAVLQVAADLGIFGLAAFLFLVFSGIRSALVLRRRLGPPARRRAPPTPEAAALTADERALMHEHTIAFGAALIGWFVCAMFASVAYMWTLYYLLALVVTSREMVRDRIVATAPAAAARTRRAGALPGRAEPLPA